MRKIVLFVILMFIIIFLSAQDFAEFDTVIEIDTEQSIAVGLEKLLFPIVGESIVLVDLKLKYPDYNFGSLSEDDKSIEKKEIQKKKLEILKKRRMGSDNDRVQVLSKIVTIYLDESVEESVIDNVEKIVSERLKLDFTNGDNLLINNSMSFIPKEIEIIDIPEIITSDSVTTDNVIQGSTSSGNLKIWMLVLVAVILGVVLLILNSTFRKGIRHITDSIAMINRGNTGNTIQVKSNPSMTGTLSSSSILEESYRNPLQISMLESKDEERIEFPTFTFLENLTNNEFFDLLESEAFGESELSYILSVLSIDYVKNLFINNTNGRVNNLINAIMNETVLPKENIVLLRERIFKSYKKTVEEQVIRTNGKDSLVKFVNNLPEEKARSVFQKIKDINEETAMEIRHSIFLFEDLMDLEDAILRDIIVELDHTMIIEFLSGVNKKVKDKFLVNMSDRMRSMIKDDLKYAAELTESEKTNAIDTTLQMIKTILNYI
jgi:flagellar motor switch protein FliG